MKKAIHDALGYLWVKNSLEADKKRKEDIAQENARIQVAINSKWDYIYATNYWGTTDLGYIGNAPSEFPYRLCWFPKDEFIAIFKSDIKRSRLSGIWWNPKFGDMRDYFIEKELDVLRQTMRNMLGEGDSRHVSHIPYPQRDEYIEQILTGAMPRAEFDDDDRMWR